MDAEVATSEYFSTIYGHLLGNQEVYSVPRQLNLLVNDITFLGMFSRWLHAWESTGEDEESMENLRSILPSLKLIWPKELKGLSLINRLVQALTDEDPDEKWMQDFHSATFELEAIIQQTKGQVEGWTHILMRSSLQYTSSNFKVFQKFLSNLSWRLDDFSRNKGYKAAEIVQQIDILKSKIRFMIDSSYRVDYMAYGEKLLPILNFIGDFAKSLACLTCLYWAKESNEENATEMY